MTLTKEDLQALSDMMDTKLDAKLKLMRTDMRNMKSDMQNMKADMQGMKKQIANIELHLENTTERNINFIAEGILI